MASKNVTSRSNPFPGLRPFAPEESDLFFGREKESRDVLDRLLANKFITIIGASGTGKSSLIYCGVLPKIKGIDPKTPDGWKMVIFRPGNDPFGNLAQAISGNIIAGGLKAASIDNILLEMHLNSDGITSALKKFLVRGDEKVLVVIDQFEELFRYSSLAERGQMGTYAAEFIEKIVRAVSQPGSIVYTIMTMRSDFIGECAHYQGLTQLINNSNYLVPHMDRENYRQVIEGPVRYAGASIDPGLVETILDDIGERTDQLPVLQHAMMRTWSYWQELDEPDRPIGFTDYDAVGTMSDAMSRHANEAFEELDARGRLICERMFRTITEKGPDNKGMRHPSSVKTIRSIVHCSADELFVVVDKFRIPSRSFITPRMDLELSDDAIIDLSHESLMRLWDRLRGWVDDEAASVQMYLRLSESSEMYQQGKTSLWRQPDLQLAINWRDQQKPTLAWAQRYNPAFERAMAYLRSSEQAFLDEEESKIRLQKRQMRRTKIIAIILGTAAMISLGFMFYAFILRIKADNATVDAVNQKILAQKQTVIADSANAQAQMQKQAALDNMKLAQTNEKRANEQTIIANQQRSIAINNANDARNQKMIADQQADSAKRASLRAYENEIKATNEKKEAVRLRMLSIGKSMSIKSLQLQGKKDLQTLLAYQAYLFNRKNGGLDNDADIYNGLYNVAVQYGSVNYKVYEGHSKENVTSIAFEPGGKEFFTSAGDGKVLKWNLDGNPKTFQVIYQGTDIIEVLAVSPDKSMLACGSNNSTIHMIPLKGSTIGYDLNGHEKNIRSLIFSFDGKYLYSASLDGKVLKWNLETKTSTTINPAGTKLNSIDVSSDGNYVAGVSPDGKVDVWNPDKKDEVFSIPVEGRDIKVVRFKPDDNILALGDNEGNVMIWDLNKRTKISEVKAHDAEIKDIRFNTILNQMATASTDKKLKIFNIKDITDLTEPPVTLSDNEGFVVVMQFSPDGRFIVSGAWEGAKSLVSRPTHVDNLVQNICTLVSRNMTRDEWNIYVGKDIEQEATCTEKSYNIKANVVK